MKKLLLVSFLVLAMMLFVSGVASANGGPHGDYTATTDACAGCHRAHTGTSGKLLIASSTYNLCVSCHGSAGSGANTNVDDGVYLSTRDDTAANADVGATNTADNGKLLGGQFANATSTHDPTGTTDQAWGAGNERGVLGTIDKPLDCASCHDPHGSPNYRIIKETINGVSVTVDQVDEGASKDYDTPNWAATQSNVCGACHNPYQHKNADTTTGTFTHKVDTSVDNKYLPASYTDANGDTVSVPLASGNTLVCQTCHFPHGTAATMTGYASNAGPAGDSALLRADNRGVCQACHKK